MIVLKLSESKLEMIKKLKQYRRAMKLTQAEVAKRLDMPRTSITRFETGNIGLSLNFLLRYADALDLEPILLLNRKKQTPQN
jgi:transcriptional regulator with XRE-family HTH domain